MTATPAVPDDLRDKIARRRAMLEASRGTAPPPPLSEAPVAALRRLCRWAGLLGPVAAQRVTPDVEVQFPPKTNLGRRDMLGREVPFRVITPAKTSMRGWKLFAATDPAEGEPYIDPADLPATNRGILLTPNGELVFVRAPWGGMVSQTMLSRAGVDYGDGLGIEDSYALHPGRPIPGAVSRLGLTAIETGLVHFAALNDLD